MTNRKQIPRRNFIKTGAFAPTAAADIHPLSSCSSSSSKSKNISEIYVELDEILKKPVQAALSFPIAGGEVENPMHSFRWQIANRTLFPIESKTGHIQSINGIIKVPTGSGLGIHIDPNYIKKH